MSEKSTSAQRPQTWGNHPFRVPDEYSITLISRLGYFKLGGRWARAGTNRITCSHPMAPRSIFASGPDFNFYLEAQTAKNELYNPESNISKSINLLDWPIWIRKFRAGHGLSGSHKRHVPLFSPRKGQSLLGFLTEWHGLLEIGL